jgi:peptidoglycan/LPS O-acetylase OafA/YrhL
MRIYGGNGEGDFEGREYAGVCAARRVTMRMFAEVGAHALNICLACFTRPHTDAAMRPIGSAAQKTQCGRIEQLDGIRAIAIAMVAAAHLELWSNGWMGVPLFFVLSGLLITRILRRDRAAASFWGPFYIKRATRILAPLAVALIIAALFFSIPWRRLGLYYLFFAANIGEVLHRGESRGLGVLWSLAVEEQYYLLWPFAIRFLNRRHLIQLLVVLLMVEPILRAVFTPVFDSMWPIYFLTPFQLDGLAAGSLLAVLLEDAATTEWLRQWSGKVALLLLVLLTALGRIPAFNVGANSIAFNSLGYSLVSLAAASLIVYVLLQPQAIVSKTLRIPFVVFLGTISYGIYLFHVLGIDLAVRTGSRLGILHLHRLAGLALVPVVIFSWLSFKFYEQPIINWGKRRAAHLSTSSRPFEFSSSD